MGRSDTTDASTSSCTKLATGPKKSSLERKKGSLLLESGDRLLCFGKLEEMRSMIPERRRRRAKVRKLPKQAMPTGE